MDSSLKLVPQLVKKAKLAPHLRQGLHILQLPLADLKVFLQAQVEENPLLELTTPEFPKITREAPPENEEPQMSNAEFDNQKEAYQQTLITPPPSLYEHLLRQLRINKLTDREYALGEYIIGNINSDGYLEAGLEDIARTKGASAEESARVLELIQGFDPLGVAGRNLAECLLLQLQARGKQDTPAARIIRSHLKDLEKKKYQEIASSLRLSLEEVKSAVEEIRRLEPKPGRSFGAPEAVRVIPDAYLERKDKEFLIRLNQEEIPQLRINQKYQRLLNDKNTPEQTRQFLQKKMSAALWVIQAIEQRKKTLRKIIKAIAEKQRKAVLAGLLQLRPLALKEIAESTGMHTSTVSRAVANKYIHTPYGTLRLKDLFSGKLKNEKGGLFSTRRIKLEIASLIKQENKNHPFTDIQIQALLCRKGISGLSRRTIVKYRQELKIPPSYLRKEAD